ncbi:hypothetical protein SAMN06297251_13127 [Fulvimarina manganoxydans]|uniref:PilZ domain-containing protein n=1 Tax=Fulvimarina manganoxydans TaxID=937218 RepID=A0A1W2ESN2_9HYPH|nr:PilZ domain-containing protein [Fulvimarina manganoxydans]SMD12188.1 hypothetical protein SAMN06297251_13127 [Fulvimarina manganoxydans]
MIEKRREQRHRVRFRQAIVTTLNKRYIEGAAFLDLSKSGARLRRFVGTAGIPEDVAICDVSERTLCNAKVAWITAIEIGLRFKGTHSRVSEPEMAALIAADLAPKETSEPKPNASEKRRWTRRKTRMRPVVLSTFDSRDVQDGMMLDISDGGARLRLFRKCDLPHFLILFDEVERITRRVKVVWINKTEMGVSYIS